MDYDAQMLSKKVQDQKISKKKYRWESDSEDFDEVKQEESFDIQDYIIISNTSKFRQVINILDTIFSILSGYMYMWFARFGDTLQED